MHRARGTCVLRRASAQSDGRTLPLPPSPTINQQFSWPGAPVAGPCPLPNTAYIQGHRVTGRHHHSRDESQKTALCSPSLSCLCPQSRCPPWGNVPSQSPWASETSLCVLVRPPGPYCPPTPAARNRSNGSQTVTLRTTLSPHHSRESVPQTPFQASSPCQHPPHPLANQGSARHPGEDPAPSWPPAGLDPSPQAPGVLRHPCRGKWLSTGAVCTKGS